MCRCKSRLLLQLAYRIAADAAHPTSNGAAGDALTSLTAAPSAGVRGDPFQPVLLLLPRRRNLETMQSAGASNQAQQKSALIGLFGPAMQADVLNNIKIKSVRADVRCSQDTRLTNRSRSTFCALSLLRLLPARSTIRLFVFRWYTDGAHLLKLICDLHLQSSSSPSNIFGVPPRFVGVLYDHTLSSEAGTLAIVMARLCEAIVTINRVEQHQFAPCQVSKRRQGTDRQTGARSSISECERVHSTLRFLLLVCAQALFVMSHVSSVARLKTLLPKYARCVFEVTHGEANEDRGG